MRIIVASIFMLLATAAVAQNNAGHYIGQVSNYLGQGVPKPTVRACTEPATGTPCLPLATIYTCNDLSMGCLGPNPFTGDSSGNIDFYALNTVPYHLQISGLSITPYDVPYVYLAGLGGGGGGGGSPCGVLYDIQIADGVGGFGCDTGIGQVNTISHTLTEVIINAFQEVKISDTTTTGVEVFGHSNGTTIDANLGISLSPTFSTIGGGYNIYMPDGPALGALTITSLTPDVNGYLPTAWASSFIGLVNYEFLYPVFSTNCALPGPPCSDLISTRMSWGQDTALLGPLPQTYPSQNVGQNTSCSADSITTIFCNLGVVGPGDKIVGFISSVPGISDDETYAVTDTQGNTYMLIDHNSGLSGIPASDVYASATGGAAPVVITVVPNLPGIDDNVAIVANFFVLHNAGSLQQHTAAGTTGSPNIVLPSITTSNANNIIIGNVQAYSVAPAKNSPGAGFAMVDETSQFSTFAGGHYLNNYSETEVVTATGTYAPHMTGDATRWVNDVAFTLSFSNTRTTNVDVYTNRIIQLPDLTNSPLAPFYQAANLTLSNLASDTLLDWHVGSPINNEGDTADYSAVVLIAVGTDAAFNVWGYVDCSGSVATVTPTITYTDAGSNSHTLTGSIADCTSHATGVIPDQTVRAKSGTNITFGTTHTGSPTWNTSAGAAQRSNQ